MIPVSHFARDLRLACSGRRDKIFRTMQAKMIFSSLVSVGFLLLLTNSGSKAQQQPRVTGFFSNMRYIPESGDVVGTEVWIVYGGKSVYATVQVAEGAPTPPVVVPVEVSGSRVRFTVKQPLVDQAGKPAPDFVTHFDATVTKAGLSGTVNSQRLNLKRRNSYWQ
jgi:hypothetical protein